MAESASLARLKELLPQLFQPVQISGESYLRFQLTPELPALLPMEQVQEAMLVSANSVTPLPNMPAFVLGLMSSRERVFCVVDLGQLLGLPPMLTNPREYQVVVMPLPTPSTEASSSSSPSSEKRIGLAVHRVRGVARFNSEQLRSPVSEFPNCLMPYLMGCIEEAEKRVLVLNAGAIAHSATLSKNPLVQR
jgi:positive phototaxis protein PixI